MKLSVEVDGESYGLELARNGGAVAYTLGGAAEAAGTAAIAEGLVFLSGLLDYLRERDQ